jgi:hypothetical protein
MNTTGTVVSNSAGDATFNTVTGTLTNASSYNSFSDGGAVFSNRSYFPHADQSCSLLQQYYPSLVVPYCTSSTQAVLTGVFNMFVTGGLGFTAEWLMRAGYGATHSNAANIWGWQNAGGVGGMQLRMTGFPEGATVYLKIYWQTAAEANQTLEVGWGNYMNREYTHLPRYSIEAEVNQGISGTWGPHNGWHHYVVTCTGIAPGGGGTGAFTLWIDGMKCEIDYAAGTNPPPSGAHITVNTQKLYVGPAPNYLYAYHMISELAFYSRSLSDTEIVTHWVELSKWNSNLSATILDPSSSLLYSVQAPAGNINYIPASSGTGNDPRATKTNPGAN